MANTATRDHLHQDTLRSKEDTEDLKDLENLAKWLAKESTKFREPSDGKRKCVDSQLVQMLQPLFQHLEFVRNVRSTTFDLNSS